MCIKINVKELREKVAKYLYLHSQPESWRDHEELRWDNKAETIDFDAVYATADHFMLTVFNIRIEE